MVGEDELADLEGDAAAILREAKVEDDEPPALGIVCERLLGLRPKRSPNLAREAKTEEKDLGRFQILIRADVPSARARWLVGHEIGEWLHLQSGAQPANIEARCDAIGAMLAAPRRAVRALIGPRRVRLLAETFGVPQSVALLRIGEVFGRPVALLRRGRPALYRGGPFVWPRRVNREGVAHLVRITDEPARVGLMAEIGSHVRESLLELVP